MKSWEVVAIFFVILCLSTIIIYNVLMEKKIDEHYLNRNKICIQLTEELQKQIDENSTCVDYYCYYMPTTLPEGYEGITTSLCVCDCLAENGEISKHHVLTYS